MTGNNHSYSPLNHKLAVILSLSFNLLFVVLVVLGHIFGELHGKSFYWDNTTVLSFMVGHFVTGLISFYLQYEVCFWVFRKKWRKRKKYPLAFLGTLAVATVTGLVFLKVMLLIFHTLPEELHHQLHSFPENAVHTLPDNLHHQLFLWGIKKDMGLAMIVFVSTLIISAFVRNQQMLVENQRLVAENIRIRHEALKNQLDPHFLFNSLNTLDGLIGLDDDKAHDFLQNLSSSFRYIFQNKEITTLKDELLFAEAYTAMMKIRYGDNLHVRYDIDERYNAFNILPISLQLLIENAVKHNVISDRHPLAIHIETTENDILKVSNAIQPKINAATGAGIGLANLAERYRLLFGLDIMITKNSVFTVEIPLIKHL